MQSGSGCETWFYIRIKLSKNIKVHYTNYNPFLKIIKKIKKELERERERKKKA